MKIKRQFTLNNFSVLPVFLDAGKNLENIFTQQIIWTDNGVRLSGQREKCPRCSKQIPLNGTYKKAETTLQKYGLCIRVQQMYCRDCGITSKTNQSILDKVIDETNQLVTNLSVLLTEAGVTAEHSSMIFRDGLGITLTGHTVSNRVHSEIDSIEVSAPITLKNIAHYDEQFFKENGKEKARITILAPNDAIPIYDVIHENATKDTIHIVLQHIKQTYPQLKRFVMDMAPRYPRLFRKVFGKDVVIAWCLFHLNKRIFLEMKSSITIGRRVQWNILDLANLYRVLGIFYDREHELGWLVTAQKRFEIFKEYRQRVGGKRKDIDKDIVQHQRMLVKEFWKFNRHLKLSRRRAKENLRLRSKEEALTLLIKWHEQKALFPKVLAKRLDYIVKHIDKFTPALENKEIPGTNNYLEAYFSSTAQQKKKKDARSPLTFPLRLKLGQLRKQGILVMAPISLALLLQRWHLIFVLFGSPPLI